MNIYCDGASIPNPGHTGIGIVIPNVLEIAKYCGPGSNQSAELNAVLKAALLADDGAAILTDSTYAIRVVTGEWKAKAHRKLIHQIREILYPSYVGPRKGGRLLLRNPRFTLQWIRGHAGHAYQEKADRLATQAARTKQNFEYRYPVSDVDALTGNRLEGNIAPITAINTVGECL